MKRQPGRCRRVAMGVCLVSLGAVLDCAPTDIADDAATLAGLRAFVRDLVVGE